VRLLIISPDSTGTACPLSGRNSTYRPVQISEAGSASHPAKHFHARLPWTKIKQDEGTSPFIPAVKKINKLPSFPVFLTIASLGKTAFFKSLVFLLEVFDEISRGKPASIFQANQSPNTAWLAGQDGLDSGGVRRGHFDCCDLHRNCTDTDG
jgi:hypothetical protein